MPLITCPDCQKEISDAAPSCIKCGRPMESKSIVKPSRDEAPTYPVDQQSLKSNQLQHPTSKETVTISNGAWLWALLFGPFYLGVKGKVGQAILWLILAMFTFGIAWLILPFFVKGILEQEYIVNGWIRGGNSLPAQNLIGWKKNSVFHQARATSYKEYSFELWMRILFSLISLIVIVWLLLLPRLY
ncbi:MAG: hypothetical protein ACJ0J6_04610 [Dehalococcoidia bacterium]